MHIAPEHEVEPEHGLPQPLPADERIVWQGSPDWKALAVRAFHVRTLAVYFGVLLVATGVVAAVDGGDPRALLVTTVTLASLATFALATTATLAWLAARTSVYTITDKRIVMRIGIVLSVTYNVPFTRIGAAAVGRTTGGNVDIALALEGEDRIAYAHLWPHARPWHVRAPEPMLRCIPDGRRVAALLAGAWSDVRGVALPPPVVADASGDRRPTSVRPSPAVPRPAGVLHVALAATEAR